MDYLIYSDVSMDIDQEFARENDIRYIPMEYELGDNRFECEGPESDDMMHKYYDTLRMNGSINTRTTQITPNQYVEIFEPLVKEGQAIIYLSLSSGLSNTYESALMAVKILKEDNDNVNIEVVDTLAGSGSMGVLAEAAVANRKAGMSLTENAEWLREKAHKLEFCFKVEDVMFLKRGGRLSATSAIIGSALNIKPLIRCNDIGKLEVADKKRGTKMAIKCLFERLVDTYDYDLFKVVYVSTADCREDAEKLKTMILEKFPETTVRITMVSPIIGAHTGPDTVVTGYIKK